jgi:hypothetical protein
MAAFNYGGCMTAHSFVLSPDGTMALDVQGLVEIDTLKERWTNHGEVALASWDRLMRDGWIRNPSFSAYTRKRARIIAKRIVEYIGL